MSGLANPFLAYLAGLLTILSPCVLPLIPIVIAGARAKNARGPLALIAGLTLTFALVGGILASFGVEFGASQTLRIIVACLMVLIGLSLLPFFTSASWHVFAPISNWANQTMARLPALGLAGQFGIGSLLALAWTPCAGPTLGAAFVLASREGTRTGVFITMAFYALGTATALLAAGYGLGKLTGAWRLNLMRTAIAGRVVFGIVFIAVGAAILTGMDKVVETQVAIAMPDWLVAFAARL